LSQLVRGSPPCTTPRRVLFLQRNFGQLNLNIITRPLIVKKSNDVQRNDKPANSQCREISLDYSPVRFFAGHTEQLCQLMQAMNLDMLNKRFAILNARSDSTVDTTCDARREDREASVQY
jgi:hypothetical protein